MDSAARIGPNALLQLVPVLDRSLGMAVRAALFARAGVPLPPPDAGMWPEAEVARLHRAVVQARPDLAPGLMRAAGLATADYILANRIPRPVKTLIGALPATLGARLLTAAIAKHAWTFAGSGRFHVARHRPLTLVIAANPLACGAGDAPSCHWHAAVFERLYATLVWPRLSVSETSCCACGDGACRFEVLPEV